MKHKWFLILGDDSEALISVDCVTLSDDAVVVDSRKVVKEEFKDSYLTGTAAVVLTVFANRAAFEAKQKLKEDSPIDALGAGKKEPLVILVVKAPSALRLTAQASYPPILKKRLRLPTLC